MRACPQQGREKKRDTTVLELCKGVFTHATSRSDKDHFYSTRAGDIYEREQHQTQETGCERVHISNVTKSR